MVLDLGFLVIWVKIIDTIIKYNMAEVDILIDLILV